MFSSAWYGTWLGRAGPRGRRRERRREWGVGRKEVSWSLRLLSWFIIRHVFACCESVTDDDPLPLQNAYHTHTHRKTHALYGAITAGPLACCICCVSAFRAPLVQDSVNNCWMDHVFTAIYSGSGQVGGLMTFIDVWCWIQHHALCNAY